MVLVVIILFLHIHHEQLILVICISCVACINELLFNDAGLFDIRSSEVFNIENNYWKHFVRSAGGSDMDIYNYIRVIRRMYRFKNNIDSRNGHRSYLFLDIEKLLD